MGKQFGDGSSSRDYTYISDIVDGVIRSIDRCHKYEVFNIGKGDGTSLKEFINLVQKYVGKTANIKILPDQPGDVPYTCADVSKAYQYLGYKATIPFEEGIRRPAEWYKKNVQQRRRLGTSGTHQCNYEYYYLSRLLRWDRPLSPLGIKMEKEF